MKCKNNCSKIFQNSAVSFISPFPEPYTFAKIKSKIFVEESALHVEFCSERFHEVCLLTQKVFSLLQNEFIYNPISNQQRNIPRLDDIYAQNKQYKFQIAKNIFSTVNSLQFPRYKSHWTFSNTPKISPQDFHLVALNIRYFGIRDLLSQFKSKERSNVGTEWKKNK